MRTIGNDIKTRNFKKVYLLYGEEAFLKQSYKNRLKKAIIGEDTMNFSYFEGKGADVEVLTNFLQTLPFFASYRCALVEDSGWFKSTNEKLVEFFATMPESSKLIFVENEVDKRNKIYKRVSEIGYVCELKHPDSKELAIWAAGILMQNGKKITGSDMDYFLSLVGEDMERMKGELDKLISYLGEREVVTEEDILAITTASVNNRIFDMIRAITSKQTKRALLLYEDLLALKEPPMRILFLIAKQFYQLYESKEMSLEGMDKGEIAKKLGLSPYVVGKLLAQARGFDKRTLLQYIKHCVELEEAIKIGNIDERMAVEILIVG